MSSLATEVGKIGRGLMVPMLIANFVVCMIMVGLAAWSIDKYIDGQQDHPHLGGNPSTTYMLEFGLLGGATGLCSLMIGLMHHREWGSSSLASASSSAFVSWAITAIALGRKYGPDYVSHSDDNVMHRAPTLPQPQPLPQPSTSSLD
ncbi:hypothetical protein E3N88_12362 [Mikania micrantha]|uniref:Uncharacterized protein n=1 Tax=Mikania micrantha TaxID=192012 RepID=A0A5N6P7A9_9ASTR|nr:hypothetical protein E3N88_12362 [Mikania micrantha]